METKSLIILVIFFGSIFSGGQIGTLRAQQVKSETASFYLNNVPQEDTVPPLVRLVDPVMEVGQNFHTEEGEIELVLKASDQSRISFVRVNRQVPIKDEAGVYFATIKLDLGLNELRIKAMDASENITDQLYYIDYQPPVVTLADRIYSESQYYGLLIGINEYEDRSMEDLNHPLADASALYRVLTTQYNFKEENTLLLRNPTRIEIMQELDALREKVDSLDNLLIFYAGHGSYDKRANTGFWLPSDASRKNKGNWYENTTLVYQLRGIRSKHTLLITDACYAGAILQSRAVNMMNEVKYEMIYDEPSRKALTSGNMTEVPDQSAFIKYLIKYLEENESEYISGEELYFKLKDPVIYNNTTNPVYGVIPNVGSENGDFVFLKDIRK